MCGCAAHTAGHKAKPQVFTSTVLGVIKVESSGPYFRQFQTEAEVRFFDVRHRQTGERTRVNLDATSQVFAVPLAPGPYEIFRVQIGEGPFQSEAQVEFYFDVDTEKSVYLGIWHLQIDSPQTVRMLHWDILDDRFDLNLIASLYPELKDQSIMVSLPQPQNSYVRLFAVAPSQPRAKYFYRR